MMDYGVAEEQNDAFYGEEQEDEQHRFGEPNRDELYPEHRGNNVNDSSGHELKHSMDDPSAGKLFVGGIAWETTEESFSRYFGKYGELTDSVIMMDKISGRPRGFGFVTFADPEVANKVLLEDHIIDGRAVEVKRTVPREDMQIKGVSKTKKIFVGGIPVSLTEDELKEYFSSYGNVLEHQIMLDHQTGRSRGFGFVTFETEDAVEKILSDGHMHELGGKQVEIKRAEPKRTGFDHSSESRPHRGGSGSKSYGNFGGSADGFEGGFGGKMGRGYTGYDGFGGYGNYGNYAANFGGNAAGFYGYGGYGYGFGFSGPMYGSAGNYGNVGGYGSATGYGVGKVYGGGSSSGTWYDGGKGYGSGGGSGAATGVGGSKGYSGSGGGAGGGSGGKGYGNGGAATGRFHPYRK